jgi:hypothetical protein
LSHAVEFLIAGPDNEPNFRVLALLRWPILQNVCDGAPSRAPEILLCFPAGEDAMIFVVEIVSRTGTRACKEYDAPFYNAAAEAVKRELRAYPTFRVTDIRIKGESSSARNNRRVVNSLKRA